MNEAQRAERAALHTRVLSRIQAFASAQECTGELDALLADLAGYQQRWVPAYARFCAQRKLDWAAPALPTDAFRFARISSRDASEDARVFHSSGTTQSERSVHAFADLSLYDAGAEAAARFMLFPDRPRMPLFVFAPRESELRDSSLSYMLARFEAWFGTGPSHYVWPVDAESVATLAQELAQAHARGEPVALLGTSFAFVHAMDALNGRVLPLAAGSRIMQTGGFKGRSRELSPEAMRAALAQSFALDAESIVAEYGMTELSSQLYETTLRTALRHEGERARRLWWPPWVRVSVVDPERLTPLPEGREGLVRIDDAANLDSVSAIQTADVGVLEAGGLRLMGRAQGAVARGCSIRADELLSERAR